MFGRTSLVVGFLTRGTKYHQVCMQEAADGQTTRSAVCVLGDGKVVQRMNLMKPKSRFSCRVVDSWNKSPKNRLMTGYHNQSNQSVLIIHITTGVLEMVLQKTEIVALLSMVVAKFFAKHE